ncbi:MAG TPA: helix-turn-helix transcriptional regulator [Thermoleophilaceae bacterium]
MSQRFVPGAPPPALRQAYASIIEGYIGGDEDQALRGAEEAGRRTLEHEGGLVCLVEAYHAALARAVAGAGSARDAGRVVQSATAVIVQSLAPYEAALAGLDRGPGSPARAAAKEQDDERGPIASAIHADPVESLEGIAMRMEVLAKQLAQWDDSPGIEKLREAVTAAHSTAVSLAGGHEKRRQGPPLPAPTFRGGDSFVSEDILTEREREILSMISAGATNAEIANRLVISQSTVKSHVKNILRKLGVRNRTHAAARYFGP